MTIEVRGFAPNFNGHTVHLELYLWGFPRIVEMIPKNQESSAKNQDRSAFILVLRLKTFGSTLLANAQPRLWFRYKTQWHDALARVDPQRSYHANR